MRRDDLTDFRILTLACMSLGIATAAQGNELGATSRATLSISITVPPHLRVSQAPAKTGDLSPGTRQLCIATNGFSAFRVAVLGAGEAVQNGVTSQPTRPLGCDVLNSGTGETILRLQSASAPAAAPMTLIIIPD